MSERERERERESKQSIKEVERYIERERDKLRIIIQNEDITSLFLDQSPP